MVENSVSGAENFGIALRIETNALPINVVRAMCDTYPDLTYDPQQGLLSGSAPVHADVIADDFRFYQAHPGIPAENVGSRLGNYRPETPSQTKVLKMARYLVYEGLSERVIGLVFSGSTGVGKTHVSVGVAKELASTGQPAMYLNPKTMNLTHVRYGDVASFYREAEGNGVLIADDFNDSYGAEGDIIRSMVTALHEHGGRLLVATNADARHLFDLAFHKPGSNNQEADAARLWSRLGHAVKFIQVDGEDRRRKEAQDPWAFFNDEP